MSSVWFLGVLFGTCAGWGQNRVGQEAHVAVGCNEDVDGGHIEWLGRENVRDLGIGYRMVPS